MGEMLALAQRVSRIGGTLVPFTSLGGPHITANQKSTRIIATNSLRVTVLLLSRHSKLLLFALISC